MSSRFLVVCECSSVLLRYIVMSYGDDGSFVTVVISGEDVCCSAVFGTRLVCLCLVLYSLNC